MTRELERIYVEDRDGIHDLEPKGVPCVYFIQARVGRGPIKIGYTTDINARFRTLQAVCPDRIGLLGLIVCRTPLDALRLEQALHMNFSEERLHSEWFTPTFALYGEIEDSCGLNNFCPWNAEDMAS